MSEARRLLAALVDMLERSNTAQLNYSIIDSKAVYADDLVKAANEFLAKPLPEPDAFIVLDSAGDHVYSSPHKQFCHDHINDLLMRDIEVDDSFVVRGFYAEPQARNYVGCGGYNADDPIDAKVFEDKIRYGIDLLLATVQAQATARRRLSDCAVMPKELTAENGAKALLMGEFYSEVVVQCEECDGDGEFDDDPCEECSGEGSITMRVPVSWTTIKAIYAMAVEHLSIKEQE